MDNTRPWHMGTCAYLLVRFVLSGTFKPTRYIPVNNELKQQVTVPVETSRTNKLRVAWEVMNNTRPVRANTADRAPHMLMTHMYVRILVCTVCFQWNIHTNPVHSSEHRVVTTGDGAGGNLKNEKATHMETNPRYQTRKEGHTFFYPGGLGDLDVILYLNMWRYFTCTGTCTTYVYPPYM